MTFSSWLRRLKRNLHGRPARTYKRTPDKKRVRPSLEELETRLVPTTSFLGVASGDASSSDVTVWTRATDNGGSATIALDVALDSGFTNIVATQSGLTTPAATDYTVKVDITNLSPGTQYFYRFHDATTDSLAGTFKTAPAADAQVGLKFAFSGDMDGLMRPYALSSQVPAENLDFYANLGDVIYETASNAGGNNNSPAVTVSGSSATLNGVPTSGPGFATQQQLFTDYSRKYSEQFLPVNTGGQAGLADFYAGQGNYTLNDNHELGNRQYINGGAPAGGSVGGPTGTDMATGRGVDARANGTGNPGNQNDAADALSAATLASLGGFMNKSTGFQTLQDVFLNYEPIKDRGTISAPTDPRTDGTQQLYFSQQWGENAIYVQTDTRSYRDIRLKTANGSADDTGARADNPDRAYLGDTQLAWLEQTLLSAQQNGTPWKFVALSDPIDEIGPIGGSLPGVTAATMQPYSGNAAYGPVSSDGGKAYIGGYRAERNALLKFIADNKIENVVFLATDDHQNRINEVTYSPTGATGNQASYVPVPHVFSIVCGPLGATGPDLFLNHDFASVQGAANLIYNAQVTAGVEPIGLMGYAGLHNVMRDENGVLTPESTPRAVDFYSPDTFNYNILQVSADGKTLTVTSRGIKSTAQNAAAEYGANGNAVHTLFSFQVDAYTPNQANSFSLTEGSATIDGTVATFADPVGTTFSPGNLVVSSSVYSGTAASVTVGQALPGGGIAVANGAYPGVFANEAPDASFGITSPIFLNQLTTSGTPIGSPLNVTAALGNTLATSFPSKSELALNLSADGTALTFMAYASAINALDISNSNTPNHIDPTNPVGTYPVNTPPTQRAVAEINANGNLHVTPVNDYSGNNGRAAVLGATGDYYMVGNAGNGGNISFKGVNTTAGSTTLTLTGSGNSTTLLEAGQPISGGNIPAGATVVSVTDATHFVISAAPLTSSASSFTATVTQTGTVLSMLSDNTGVQMIAPGAGGETTVVGQQRGVFGSSTGYQRGFSITDVGLAADKTGKDDNFRGLTINPFDGAIYVSKGSGSNGVDTVYKVTPPSSALPTLANAGTSTISILPGFPVNGARDGKDSHGVVQTVYHPFGLWFADANTLYVGDEGDGTSTGGAVAGLEKWSFNGTIWQLDYTLTNGLNLGAAYSVANGPNGEVYPVALDPATNGLRNITGKVNGDGTVSIYAITATFSTNTDQGADPNRLVAITDTLADTTAAQAAGESFTTLRTARYGEVLRGVSFTPNPADHYTATIDWGDGATTDGTVSVNGTGFSVAGTHTYAEEGTFPVTTTLTHLGFSTVVTGTATVADAAVTLTAAAGLTPVEATSTGTVEVARFTDPGNPAGTLDPVGIEYSAVIDWGDGGPTTAVDSTSGGITLVSTGPGGSVWSVQAAHTYAEATSEQGNVPYSITVAITHDSLPPVSMATSSATVSDPNPVLGPLAFSPHQLDTTHGQAVPGQTVTFTTPYFDVPNDGPHTVTISWGDSSPDTAVTATELTTTTGSAMLSHVYTSYGTYSVTETVKDDGSGVSTQTFTVNIVPVDLQPCSPPDGMLQLVVGSTQFDDDIHVDIHPDHGQVAYNVQIHTKNGNTDLGNFQSGNVVVPNGLCQVLIFDLNGNDKIHADTGNTGVPVSVFGGNGNDQVELGDGNNTVVLGNGNDDVQLGNGNNTVMLGNGNDSVHAGNGTNSVQAGAMGSAGNVDIHLGNGAHDSVLLLGNGNDSVQIGNGDYATVTINGNGNDSVQVGNGDHDSVSITGNGKDSVKVGNGIGDLISVVGNGDEDIQTGNGAGVLHLEGTGHNKVKLGKGWTQI